MNNQPKRLLALDIMRGMTVASMILVDNPGTWEHVFAPLNHAQWNGLTPTDLVFPFFIFMMGVSMYFSLSKFDFHPSKSAFYKIIRRSAVILLLGYIKEWFSQFCSRLIAMDGNISLWERIADAANNFDTMRIPGVLTRIALCYFIASILIVTIRNRKALFYIAIGLLIVYSGILIFGNGYDFSSKNIIYIVDHAVFGDSHIYSGLTVDGVNIPFDPEGLLSSIPVVAQVLLGFLLGGMIKQTAENEKLSFQLFIIGFGLTALGWLLSYGLPINKNIWSPTFVLVTTGIGAALLGFLIWLIDICGLKKWCIIFEPFGSNALFSYALSAFLIILFNAISLKNFIYQNICVALFGDTCGASLMFALLFDAFIWLIVYILYRKKIYIKI